MFKKENLRKDLEHIGQIFPLTKLIQTQSTLQDIQKYFHRLNKLYRFFHSKEGAMHLPLYLEKGQHHAKALLSQVKLVSGQITENKTSAVLELGCGLGYNSLHLADLHPDVAFTAFDLNERQIKYCLKRSRGKQNLSFEVQDYHQLSVYRENSFDLVFAIETLCYARDWRFVFAGVQKILKPGGKFIIIDVFQQKALEDFEKDLQTSLQLAATAFAVQQWPEEKKVKEVAIKHHFSLSFEEDFTENVLPNLYTFYKNTSKFLFKKNLVNFLLNTGCLPQSIFKHIIGGLMAPYTLEMNGLSYKLLLFKKE